jgi:hypothetical protein
MNSFVVPNCTYDGTSGDPNPLCYVIGTVNGMNVDPPTFFRYLMAASTAGQMQATLAAAMFNFYAGYGATLPWSTPFPSFPPSNAAATHSRAMAAATSPPVERVESRPKRLPNQLPVCIKYQRWFYYSLPC